MNHRTTNFKMLTRNVKFIKKKLTFSKGDLVLSMMWENMNDMIQRWLNI